MAQAAPQDSLLVTNFDVSPGGEIQEFFIFPQFIKLECNPSLEGLTTITGVSDPSVSVSFIDYSTPFFRQSSTNCGQAKWSSWSFSPHIYGRSKLDMGVRKSCHINRPDQAWKNAFLALLKPSHTITSRGFRMAF